MGVAFYQQSPPDLELAKAPFKDTLNIPRDGYAIVRIRADNPGIWFLHCHVAHHETYGMSMVIAQLDGPERVQTRLHQRHV